MFSSAKWEDGLPPSGAAMRRSPALSCASTGLGTFQLSLLLLLLSWPPQGRVTGSRTPKPPSWTSPPRPHLEAGPGFAGSSAQGHTRGRRRSGELVSCSLPSCGHICWTPPCARETNAVGARGPVKYSSQQRWLPPPPGGRAAGPTPSLLTSPSPWLPCLLGKQTPDRAQPDPCDPKRSPPCSSNDSAWTRASGDSSLAHRGLGRLQDSTEFCH